MWVTSFGYLGVGCLIPIDAKRCQGLPESTVLQMANKSPCISGLLSAIIASAFIFIYPFQCAARFPEAEGGTFVRLEAETPVATATEEKDIAFTHLRRWGLGSQRQFVEVSGEVL